MENSNTMEQDVRRGVDHLSQSLTSLWQTNGTQNIPIIPRVGHLIGGRQQVPQNPNQGDNLQPQLQNDQIGELCQQLLKEREEMKKLEAEFTEFDKIIEEKRKLKDLRQTLNVKRSQMKVFVEVSKILEKNNETKCLNFSTCKGFNPRKYSDGLCSKCRSKSKNEKNNEEFKQEKERERDIARENTRNWRRMAENEQHNENMNVQSTVNEFITGKRTCQQRSDPNKRTQQPSPIDTASERSERSEEQQNGDIIEEFNSLSVRSASNSAPKIQPRFPYVDDLN